MSVTSINPRYINVFRHSFLHRCRPNLLGKLKPDLNLAYPMVPLAVTLSGGITTTARRRVKAPITWRDILYRELQPCRLTYQN